MILFFRKISSIILILLSSVVTIYIINISLYKSSTLFIFNDNIKTLILGDSQSKYAFNDKILLNTINFSADAESYLYSYIKLKEIYFRNKQIDTLLLSFTEHSISKDNEKRWLLNNGHINNRFPKYFPFFGQDEFKLFLQKKPNKILTGMFSQVLFPIYLLAGNNIFGGYENLKHNILEDEVKKNGNKSTPIITQLMISEIEKKYLIKIADFCSGHEITLILVHPPVHKLLQDQQQLLYKFKNKYLNNVIFFDLSKVHMEDSYFGDLVHLNSKGAEYFSSLIKKVGISKLAECI